MFLLRLTSARSSGFSFAQVSTGDRLDPCHKRCISYRAAAPYEFSERSQWTVVRGEKQSLPIPDKSWQGSICDQRVVLRNPHVKSRTRPGIIPWYFGYTGPYRILFHIPRCCQQVTLVQNTRMESPLEEVTTDPGGEVLHAGVSPVSPAKPSCQRVFSMRYGYKVDMVGHETPDKYRDHVPRGLFPQHSKILTTIRFFMKDAHGPNTTLRDVMRITGYHYARQTSHGRMAARKLHECQEKLLYVPRYEISADDFRLHSIPVLKDLATPYMVVSRGDNAMSGRTFTAIIHENDI